MPKASSFRPFLVLARLSCRAQHWLLHGDDLRLFAGKRRPFLPILVHDLTDPRNSCPDEAISSRRPGKIGRLQAGAWRGLRAQWLVLAGALVAALPAAIAVGRDVWTTEQGAHGPIILVTGLWLLARETPRRPRPLSGAAAWAAIAAMVPAGLIVVFAAIIGKVWLQAAATYALLLLVYALCTGPTAMRRAWFPLFYLGFLVPPPPPLIVPATRALKLALAGGAAQVLAMAGYNTASQGAYLYIDSYELVVAAACAGLNSLTSLLAVGLLYAFLRHRADPVPLAILAACALPIAIAANFLRVVLLLLVTHYLGSGEAQGLLHDAAGLTTFTLALGVMALLDLAIGAPWHLRQAGAGARLPAAKAARATRAVHPSVRGASR